jgi:hypothetical protein
MVGQLVNWSVGGWSVGGLVNSRGIDQFMSPLTFDSAEIFIDTVISLTLYKGFHCNYGLDKNYS